jgi:hypothetical protein
VRGAPNAFTRLRCGGHNSLESVFKAPNLQISSSRTKCRNFVGKKKEKRNKRNSIFRLADDWKPAGARPASPLPSIGASRWNGQRTYGKMTYLHLLEEWSTDMTKWVGDQAKCVLCLSRENGKSEPPPVEANGKSEPPPVEAVSSDQPTPRASRTRTATQPKKDNSGTVRECACHYPMRPIN